MAIGGTRPPRRLLVIGPMGTGLDQRGLPLGEHIPNIARAARRVLARLRDKLGDAMPPCDVHEPPDDQGEDIPHGVFSLIMHCDFAIADISTSSPNVMYELAMLHANGVPVILVGQPIFYLNQTNCIQIDDFRMESLELALSGQSFEVDGRPGPLEKRLLSPNERANRNPITQFFGGVHMINVAAATGVATGQFYNFLSYVIKDGGFFKKFPEIKKIVLIKPKRFSDVDPAIEKLKTLFGSIQRDSSGSELMENGKPKRELPEIIVHDADHPRDKYFVKRVGAYAVDYPTPISSLKVSRQYIGMGEFLKIQPKGGFSDDELERFEGRLINVYFQTLEDLSQSPANTCDWSRVEVLSLEDAIELISS